MSVIREFNPPQDEDDLQEILHHALHATLHTIASVSDCGNVFPALAIQWDDSAGDEVHDGVLLYLTDSQHIAFNRAVRDGRLFGHDAAAKPEEPTMTTTEEADDDDTSANFETLAKLMATLGTALAEASKAGLTDNQIQRVYCQGAQAALSAIQVCRR
jgi:hypothetical protein